MTSKKITKAWAMIKRQRIELAASRRNDIFLSGVLKGAVRVARDAKNPIRGNLFAAASREALTHLLHVMAPDQAVRACVWFEQAEDTKTVTRAQRANFIAHGGLRPDYVEETLNLSREEYLQPLNEAISTLNKLTHVKAETVIGGEKAVLALAKDTFNAMGILFDAADECRTAVAEALRAGLNEEVMNRMISETIAELDELSTHTLVEEVAVEEIEVVEIGPQDIRMNVEGTVYVTLQYGSGSDMRNDIGATMSDSYPFSTTARARVREPQTVTEVAEPRVDNSHFYE